MESKMNWDRIEGNWKQLKGKVKEQWGELTDDDLDRIAGRKDQLAGRLQETYGIGKDEAEKQIDRWAETYDDSDLRSNDPRRSPR
jgi:uncharacterized protein YjbJ (UPF0337 family)